MNTKNNRKFQETDAHICATFLDLLETHDFDNISISLLCQKAGITRATFYSHFGDMNHFFDAVAQRLFLELRDEDCANFRKMDSQGELHHASILSLFEHILKYRSFYQVYITQVHSYHFCLLLPPSNIQRAFKNMLPAMASLLRVRRIIALPFTTLD